MSLSSFESSEYSEAVAESAWSGGKPIEGAQPKARTANGEVLPEANLVCQDEGFCKLADTSRQSKVRQPSEDC